MTDNLFKKTKKYRFLFFVLLFGLFFLSPKISFSQYGGGVDYSGNATTPFSYSINLDEVSPAEQQNILVRLRDQIREHRNARLLSLQDTLEQIQNSGFTELQDPIQQIISNIQSVLSNNQTQSGGAPQNITDIITQVRSLQETYPTQIPNNRSNDLSLDIAQIEPDQLQLDYANNQISEAWTSAVAEGRAGQVIDISQCSINKLSICFQESTLWATAAIKSAAAWLLTVVGWFFNNIILATIINFRDLATNKAVEDMWVLARDFSNIFFIFILLYAAIGTVLQLGGIDAKKIITNVIIIAIIINFSAVITRSVFDVSNIATITFYDLIVGEGDNKNIANKFTANVGINEIEKINIGSPDSSSKLPSYPDHGSTENNYVKEMVKNIGMTIFYVMTIFVLFITSGMFLIRGIIIVVLIISSPFAFMGYVIPFLKSNITNRWWQQLKAQALFAPIFMFCFYVTLTIAEAKNNLPNSDDSIFNDIFWFALIIGLMFSSTLIAKKLGAEGASQSSKYGRQGWNKITGFAGGVAGGLTASTIGRLANTRTADTVRGFTPSGLANRFASSKGLQDFVANRGNVVSRGLASSLKSGLTTVGSRYENKTKTNTEARQASLKAAMANMTDEQKAKYMSGASTAEQADIYASLSDKEKAQVELEAQKAGHNIDFKKIREGLKGEKKESLEKAVESEKQKAMNKAAQGEEGDDQKPEARYARMAEFIEKQSEEDRKMLYEKLSDVEKADMEAYMVDAKDEKAKMLSDLRGKLLGEKGDKVNSELKKSNRKIASKKAKGVVKNLMNLEGTLSPEQLDQLKNNFNNLSAKDVLGFDPEILKNEQIVKLMNKDHIAQIHSRESDISNTDREIIKKIVEQGGTESAKSFYKKSPIKKAEEAASPSGGQSEGSSSPNTGHSTDWERAREAATQQLREQNIREQNQ